MINQLLMPTKLSSEEEHTVRSNMRRIRETTPCNGGKPLSLRQLADKFDVSSVVLSRFETGNNGSSKFNAKMVQKYSETLGVPLHLFYQASEVDLLDISRRRYEKIACELAETQKKLELAQERLNYLRDKVCKPLRTWHI